MRRRGRCWLHDGTSIVVGQPAGEEVYAEATGDVDLVVWYDAGGGVEDKGRLLVGGSGEGDGVGAEAGDAAESGDDGGRTACHADADHVVLEGDHGVVGGHG